MVDADSVVAILEDELQKPSMQSFVNAKVIVGVLRVYRDWRQHVLDRSPVHLDACFHFMLYLIQNIVEYAQIFVSPELHTEETHIIYMKKTNHNFARNTWR